MQGSGCRNMLSHSALSRRRCFMSQQEYKTLSIRLFNTLSIYTGRIRSLRSSNYSTNNCRVSLSTIKLSKTCLHSKSTINTNPHLFDDVIRWFSSTTSVTLKSLLSRRNLAEIEELVVQKVAKQIHDPILQHKSLHQLQWLHNRIVISDNGDGNTFRVLLKLPSLLHPKLDELKQRVQQVCSCAIQEYIANNQDIAKKVGTQDLPQVCVNVEVLPSKPVPVMARLVESPEELLQNLGPGLNQVAHFVAVYSCKGGVGKSTVAVNLAYELAHQGGRVGLLDLDLYGPSLPVLVRPDVVAVRRSDKGPGMVYPIEFGGVKMLSFGFVSRNSGVPGSGSDNGAAIMRGALVIKAVTQLLKSTDWGDLDVLVLDLPPGTGDTQLAVLQDLQLSGAVAVTTPSKLAITDTQKGIEMFHGLGVPTFAVVENMSYFMCEGGKKHYPFGSGLSSLSLKSDMNLTDEKVIKLPLSSIANDAVESGRPLCLTRPAQADMELSEYKRLAANVSKELLKLQYGDNNNEVLVTFPNTPVSFSVETVHLSISKSDEEVSLIVRFFSDAVAVQEQISGRLLRSSNPKTGEVLQQSHFLHEDNIKHTNRSNPIVKVTRTTKTNPSIIPVKVQKKGRYGFSVEWADGATIIYSNMALASLAGGVKTRKDEQDI